MSVWPTEYELTYLLHSSLSISVFADDVTKVEVAFNPNASPKEGDDVTVSCIANGNPLPAVRLKKLKICLDAARGQSRFACTFRENFYSY